MKRLFILSSTLFDEYQHLFIVLKNNRIALVRSQVEIGIYPTEIPHTTLCPPPAMLQLRDKIIDYLIWTYIKTNCYHQAIALITINKATIRRFYNKFYESFYPKTIEYTRLATPAPEIYNCRISRTLQFMQNIFQTMYRVPSADFEGIAAFETTIDTNYFPHYSIAPWDFAGMMDLYEYDSFGVSVINIPQFHQIKTGPYVHDFAWIHGGAHRGVIASDFVKLPVIILILKDPMDNLIPQETIMRHNRDFKNFARILKYCFGGFTGVFVAVVNTPGHMVLLEM